MWERHPDRSEPDPLAVPGIDPDDEDRAGDASFTLEVDGELFALRPDGRGGTHYTWVSGPNDGYGFTMSPTADLGPEEHPECIRSFLAQIDPATGYLGEDD